MKTLIAIPCMDMVHTVFMRSLIGMDKVGAVQFGISCSSLIYDARNGLCKQAIKEKCDRILWLDSDMDFSPDFMKILSADMDEGREFVSGLYFKRKAPIQPVIYREVGYWRSEDGSVTPIALPFDDYPRDQIFPIKGAGFGGVMVSVDLVNRVVEKFGQPFSPILGFGEDLSFCKRVEELGVPMYCDSRAKMGHVGLGTITEDLYLRTLEVQNGRHESDSGGEACGTNQDNSL